MRILIGTANPGKADEYRRFLAPHGLEIVSLEEMGLGAIEERGDTFEDIAIDKARTYARASGLLTLADDSGLEVDALGGLPGIRSRRWLGHEADDMELMEGIVERMKDVPDGMRQARLKAVAALMTPEGDYVTVVKAVEGTVTREVRPDKLMPGYPYRGVFKVDAFDKLYADLTHEEHEAINHRRAAIEALLPTLKRYVGHQ